MQDDENYDKRNEKQKKKKAMTEEETMVLQALNNWLFNMLRLVWLGTNFPFSEPRSNVACKLLVSNGDDRVFTSECFRCTQKTAGGFDLFEQFTAQHYGVVRGKNEKRFFNKWRLQSVKGLASTDKATMSIYRLLHATNKQCVWFDDLGECAFVVKN